MDAISDATRERPWLWALILVVVVLPIVLIIAYCCMSKSEVRPTDRSDRLGVLHVCQHDSYLIGKDFRTHTYAFEAILFTNIFTICLYDMDY